MACITDAFNRADTISTSTLISDAFNRANGAIGNADTGGAWSVLAGNWQVVTNQAACTDGTSRQDNVAVIDSGAADVTVTVDVPVKATAAEAGAGIGIAFRSSDVSNRLQLIVFTSAGGTISFILQKIVAGVPTTLNSVVATPSTIQITCAGSMITCYADGNPQFTVTETFNQAVTKHGLTSYWSTVGRLDNFTCTTLLNTGLGNADTGQAWVEQKWAPYDGNAVAIAQAASKLGIISNQVTNSDTVPDVGTTGVGHVDLATIEHSFANFDLGVDVIAPFARGGGGGLIFRWAGDASFWQAFLFRGASLAYTFILRKVTASSGTTFTDVLVATDQLPNGTTGAVRVRVVGSGSSLTSYVNGVNLGVATDAYNVAATKHGIDTYFSTSVRLDNYSGCPVGTVNTGPYVGAILVA